MKFTNMRSFITLITFIILSFTAVAQKGKIEGKITDAKTGQAIAGVTVMINGSKSGVSSNNEGYLVLTHEAGKKYSLTLSSVKYKTK